MTFHSEEPERLTATTGRSSFGDRWYLMVHDRSVDRDDWPRHYWARSFEAPSKRVRENALRALGYEAVSPWEYTETELGESGAANWGLVVQCRPLVTQPAVRADVDDLVDANALTPEGAAA